MSIMRSFVACEQRNGKKRFKFFRGGVLKIPDQRGKACLVRKRVD